MTGSEMVGLVKILVEDTNNWLETNILNLINRAQDQILAHLDSVGYCEYYNIVPITLIAGTKEYALVTASNWRKVVKIVDEANCAEVNLIDPIEWPQLDPELRYRAAWIDKCTNKLKFFENPTDTNTYNVYYVGATYLITMINSPTQLPLMYHQLIPLKAALMVLRTELQRSELQQDYNELLQCLIENSQTGVRAVRDVRGT